MAAMTGAPTLKIKMQILCGHEIAMGPGKADLLEAIIAEGSISGAGRKLGMSYRRTWLLVDVMNRCWEAPLVETAAGGSHGGGAHVTDLGKRVLAWFRALQQASRDLETGTDWRALQAVLRAEPKLAQSDP
jgi:molybdate transport system regulatory protein